MSNCAMKRCSNPDCGPCTIYDRFPVLRAYGKAKRRDRVEKNTTRDGIFDPVTQSLKAAQHRKRRGPKDMR